MKHAYRVIRRTQTRFEQPRRLEKFRCRCRRCGHRQFMERHPANYSRGFACASCGRFESDRELMWRIDWYRTCGQENRDRGVCHCGAAEFPHRPGCGRRGRDVPSGRYVYGLECTVAA